MLWEYITDKYEENEPIISSDIEVDIGKSELDRRFKELTAEGRLRPYEDGVYYIPKMSQLGGEMPMLPDRVIESKYISRNKKVFGYYSGLVFANQIGATTQMPAVQEITTSEIENPIERIEKGNRLFVIRKARTTVTEDNARILQLLDFLEDTERLLGLSQKDICKCAVRHINRYHIAQAEIGKYLPLYSDDIHLNLRLIEENIA